MQIQIIAVGKLKEKYLKDGINEYLKRLQGYARVEIIEVADEKEPNNPSPADEALVREKEAARIRGKMKADSYVIALAIQGEALSSTELAARLDALALAGRSHITLLIGGSLGLADDLLRQADMLLSFSRMTFPHQLMRLILAEQLYRCFRISKGEPYHK